MKQIASLMVLMLCSFLVRAQIQIVVQKGENASFFLSLKEAIVSAEAGSTIYLPAGVFETQELKLDKQIRIVGIGHNPSANPNNTFTELKGGFTFTPGADNSSFEGIRINGTWRMGTTDDVVSLTGVSFSRCYFISEGVMFLSNGTSLHPVKDLVFHECILSGIDGGSVQNVLFLKCLFRSSVANLNGGSTFRNNIFLNADFSSTFYEVSQATFENNVFLCSFNTIKNSTLLNNIFISGFAYDFTNLNNIVSGNITGLKLSEIFVNVPTQKFEYFHDYRLSSLSGGARGGTDGTDIGIFGTTQPFRTSGVPDVPHIDAYTIGSATDNQGRLTISVKVSAQGN